MTDPIDDVVLIGGGLAAAKAAESLRDAGYTGRLTLVADEPERPYERPPLSKGLLLGTQTVDDVYVHDADWYATHDVEVVTGDAAARIDRDAGAVHTASGRRLPFDRMLLATGAAPRRLPFDTGALDGITVLRTLADSRDLAARLGEVGHVTVAGAGWIGCEVAAGARTLGVEVTLIDPLVLPLVRVLGPALGRVFRDLHADHGVDLRLETGVTAVDGDGRIERVTLTDGTTIDTQLLVTGIGVTPRTELAEQAGLPVNDGIVVDQTLTSSDPRILAAGDVANAWHPLLHRQLRVEHWANALHQGLVAGRNLLGAAEPFERLPYFFSDQYDFGMEYTGHGAADDEVVFRGAPESREFVAFWLRDGRVTAAMNANVWDVGDDLRGLIASGATVDVHRLTDADVPLGEAAAGAAETHA